ncbi:MAG: MAPEG family protein [Roseiarcus sp.]
MTLAFWCVLIAAILPHVPFGLAAGKLDRHTPRLSTPKLEGLAARAYGAHLNAFEAFPPFAAAVIIAHLVEGPNSTINILAALFIVARVAHLAFYLADRQPLRTTAFFAGFVITIAIFLQSAFH